MFLLSAVKQAWTLVLPADRFPLGPQGGLAFCYRVGGTCMLWERLLLSPGVGGW